MDAQSRIAPEFEALMTKYNVNVAGLTEAIWQPQFDTLDYPSAGQNELIFFQNPIGQNGKTEEETNMVSAGQIAAPQQFLATGIRLEFLSGVAIGQTDAPAANLLDTYVRDVQAVTESGNVSFTVGNKIQNTDSPIGKFPPSHLLEVEAALQLNAADGGISYAQSTGQLYNITPTNIPYSQNLNVKIRWTTAVALPSTIDGTIRCHLEGFLYRSAQ